MLWLYFKYFLNNNLLNFDFSANASNKFKSNFYLVFEFCEHDLAGLLSNPQVKFSLGEQKKIMQQIIPYMFDCCSSPSTKDLHGYDKMRIWLKL